MADRRSRRELPVIHQRPVERADAVRNRRRILRAAADLITNRGAEKLSLDEVAAAAEVGVGTVYRRFGDRAGVIRALLDEREIGFQEAFMYGPPPLGPGASAGSRIRAFLHAKVDQVHDDSNLLLVTENVPPAVRYGEGPYPLHHLHLVTLLRETRPEVDTGFLAHALLAPCSASLLVHQLHNEGRGSANVKSGIDDLLRFVGVPHDEHDAESTGTEVDTPA